MKNQPKYKGFFKVAKILKRAAKGEVVLDMSMIRIEIDKCGTIACVGGHFAHQTLLDENSDEVKFKSNVLHHKNDCVDFFSGTKKIANECGFQKASDMAMWAENNPEIWGNEFGCNMFIKKNAYAKNSVPLEVAKVSRYFNARYSIGLKNVAEHFKQVGERLKKQEERENV